MSANIIESFFVSLGFEINTEKLEEFQQKAEALRASVLKLGAIATGAAVGIGTMVLKVAEGMDEVGDFADIVGLAAIEVDALGKVAATNDSSLEAMKSTLDGLSSIVGQAADGIPRATKMLSMFGLEARDAHGNVKDVTTVLGEVADKFRNMSAAEKIGMASRLGIDKTLIPLLSKGKENFIEMKNAAEAAIVAAFGSKEAYEKAIAQSDRITKAWYQAKMSLGIYTKLLSTKLFPIMEKVLNRYNDWIKNGKKSTNDAVATGLKSVAAALETVWDWCMRAVDGIQAVYDWMTQFKVVIWASVSAVGAMVAYQVGSFFLTFGKAVSAAATALWEFNIASAIPVILIGGIVIAMALLVDELVNYYEGNETIIGQLNNKFPGAIYGAWGALVALGGAFIALKWKAITSMLQTMAGLALYAATWVASHAWMAASTIALNWSILLIIAAIAAIVGAVWYLWKNWDKVTGYLGEAWETVKTEITDAFERVMAVFDEAKKKVMGFIDTVVNGIGKVGELLGLTNEANKVNMSIGANNSPSAQATANNSLNARGGVIGAAGSNTSNSSSVTNTTHVSGTTININSPDPAKAGEAVKNELAKMNKQTIRNGQTSVVG